MTHLTNYKKLAADVVRQMDDDYGCDECGAVGLDQETRNLAEAVLRLTAALEKAIEQRDANNKAACYYEYGNHEKDKAALNAEIERILAGDDAKGAGDGEG